MTYELPVEEKLVIVEDHLKNVTRNSFNLTLTLGEHQSLSETSKDTIASLNKQIKDFDSQIKFLSGELESLKKQIPTE